jgi:hypothetical protein
MRGKMDRGGRFVKASGFRGRAAIVVEPRLSPRAPELKSSRRGAETQEKKEKSITQTHRATEERNGEPSFFSLSVALWLCVTPSVLFCVSA